MCCRLKSNSIFFQKKILKFFFYIIKTVSIYVCSLGCKSINLLRCMSICYGVSLMSTYYDVFLSISITMQIYLTDRYMTSLTNLSICLSVYLSIYLSVYITICLSVYLSIRLLFLRIFLDLNYSRHSSFLNSNQRTSVKIYSWTQEYRNQRTSVKIYSWTP